MEAMKRRLIYLAILAVLGLAAVWLLWPAHGHRITQANFNQIQKGMQETDVEGILGVPEGTYTDGPPSLFKSPSKGGVSKSWKTWRGDAGAAFIGFDRKGEVTEKYFVRPLRSYDSFLGKLRRWLGL
jgi:hypothetical protein